ncbi:2-aminoethanethiol dioxygenase-like isoform X2 [Xenia sp. Carnegie-2017]|uniref:2-aminoethanethiol dioxygenase-like isoform X2 n=1 Tax=Xenia sp. Carnegie-2017 TaxID=2897299 RepID=UPI001F03D358|nr:2-aminoethanethiol dioxygenase-like isoform X2 [Xenia sp. Carnegie-2017]
MVDMANIQKLARQAFKTFRSVEKPPTKENLDTLKEMMSTITVNDVNLSRPNTRRRSFVHHFAPVTHVNIIDCSYFSMAIFIVDHGCRLPLHNHPGMYGFCKVLYGQIEVEMYSPLKSEQDTNGIISKNDEYEKFLYQGKHQFDSKSVLCTVTPCNGNLHSISAVSGPAAFLDILGPPYSSDEGRDCIYYKKCCLTNEESRTTQDPK